MRVRTALLQDQDLTVTQPGVPVTVQPWRSADVREPVDGRGSSMVGAGSAVRACADSALRL
ncbi:hypothetical protein TR51_18280 [Kitasatospora griseola]|uniref:Uncharacterized protein n=1 Tax=Kitasatospora griseola TaxID=2064 RepID=A0A0D0PZN8_KITGR|nr:hypothetical protein TR51_18280 [Kitasatospora griseola]